MSRSKRNRIRWITSRKKGWRKPERRVPVMRVKDRKAACQRIERALRRSVPTHVVEK